MSAGPRMTAVSLGMPEAPPPVLAPRRTTRQIQVGKVGVGSDSPDLGAVDVDDAHLRRQHHPPADRRADRVRLRHRPGRLSQPGRRRRASRDRPAQPDPGDRRHPLPAEVRLRRHRGGLRGRPGQPRQHPQVRRPGQGDREGREGPRHARSGSASTPGQPRQADPREVRQGHPGGARRARGLGGGAVRGARLPRLQDLGQAQRPRGHGARLRAARRGGRLAAAPRRDRGRTGVPGHDQVRRSRSAPC